MNSKKTLLFLMLFALFAGMLPAQNGPTLDDHGLFDYCGGTRYNSPIRDRSICVQDRWNNPIFECIDKLEDPRRGSSNKMMGTSGPTYVVQPLAPVNCNNGFIITFEDIESNTNVGFDDNTLSPCGTGLTLGQERVILVCSVFDYISSVINMGSINVEIYFPLSEFDGTGPLATATPLFDTGIPAGTFTAGYVRDHIVNQSDPNISAFDGTITMDFGTRTYNGVNFDVFPCQGCPGIGDIDMFSIVLHEATHALGFFSFVSANGTSGYSGSLAGPYSLYDQHLFNASNSDLINGGANFLGPVGDLTSDLLTYLAPGNTQNEPVYSPTGWNPGSSMSHFDDTRSNFEYVMRPATSGEDSRTYTMAEMEVLVNLGYALNPSVFTVPQSFNNYVIGADDIGYTTPQATQICVPALNNDFDPDGPAPIQYGNCGTGCNAIPAQLTLMLGSGTVSIVGNDVCFTPDPWYAGPVVIKYCPTDGQYDPALVNTDNCTFINIQVTGPCPGDPCNLVCNGDMENRADPCVSSYNSNTFANCPSPFIADWCKTTGTPDVHARGCPGNSSPAGWFDIPNNFLSGLSPLPGTEVWDAPNPNNNTYLGMGHNDPAGSLCTEGVYVPLNQTLVVGKTYNISFYASAKHQLGTTPAAMVVGLNAGVPVSTNCQANTPVDWYAVSNSPVIADFTVPTTVKSVLGVWNFFSFTVTPTVAGLDHLLMEPSTLSAAGARNYIFFDDVRVECDDPPIQLTKTVSNATPNPGDIITYSIVISNNHPTNAANNLNIQDLLPAGVTYISSTLSNPPSNHFIPVLNPLSAQLVTITAQVDPNPPLGVPITNCAYVTAGNNCLNINGTNCVDIIVGGTDVSVAKALISGAGPYTPGSPATFQITVTNNGPLSATNVLVQDILPTGLSYVSHSITGPGSFAYPNLTIPSLANGGSTVLTLNVVVNSSAPCATINNCANLISMNEQDLLLSNNSDCDAITIGSGGGSGIAFPIHPFGTQREQARGVEWTSGGFYVTGYLTDVIDFGFGAMNSFGSIDSYVIKYGSCGLDWQHNEGTAGVENGVAIMENTANGRVYACGNFSQSFNYQGVNLAGSGAYVVALDPSTGAAQWGRTIQGCRVENIDVDPITGNVAVTGGVTGGFVFAGVPHTSVGSSDIFVAVYSGAGLELWADTYGGAGYDIGMGLVQHTNSRLYVATSIGGPPSTPFGGTAPAFSGGNSDGFMGVWNPGGIQAGGFYFGSGGDDALNDADAAPGGDIYIVGNNGGAMNALGTPIISNGARDAFVLSVDQGMSTVNWNYDWGSTSDWEYGRAVDEEGGRVFVTGEFRGTVNFPGFPNPVLSSVASNDVFMASIVGATGAPINNLQSTNPAGNWIQCFDIDNDGAGNGYIPGQFFRTIVLGGATISSPSGGTDAYVGRGDGSPGGNFYKLTRGDGLAAGLSELELEVFPNPSTGHLTVRVVAGEAEQVKLTLIDLQGRVQVLTEAGAFESGELELDLSEKAQGLYFLQMEVNGLTQTEKLILMRD